jgi:hypothetical protein
MTNNLEELRAGMRSVYREQVTRAAAAARAVPVMPNATYRRRLLSALTEAAPDCSEKDLFQAWRDTPEMARFVTILHTALCTIPLSRLSIRYEDEVAR